MPNALPNGLPPLQTHELAATGHPGPRVRPGVLPDPGKTTALVLQSLNLILNRLATSLAGLGGQRTESREFRERKPQRHHPQAYRRLRLPNSRPSSHGGPIRGRTAERMHISRTAQAIAELAFMTVGNSVLLKEGTLRKADLIVHLIEADDFPVPAAPHLSHCYSCHLRTLCRLEVTLDFRHGQRVPGKEETMTRATVWYPMAITDLWEILAVASVLVCHH